MDSLRWAKPQHSSRHIDNYVENGIFFLKENLPSCTQNFEAMWHQDPVLIPKYLVNTVSEVLVLWSDFSIRFREEPVWKNLLLFLQLSLCISLYLTVSLYLCLSLSLCLSLCVCCSVCDYLCIYREGDRGEKWVRRCMLQCNLWHTGKIEDRLSKQVLKITTKWNL